MSLRPTSKRLIAPGNMCITVLGEFDSVLRVGSRKHTERLYVVDQTNPLLGREACVKLGLITCNVSDVSVNDSCSEFKELRQVNREVKIATCTATCTCDVIVREGESHLAVVNV